MSKPSQMQKGWLNLKVNLQKQALQIRKELRGWLRQSKPFLQGKYWLIYLFFFGMGFYLFGPGHGYRQLTGIKGWSFGPSPRESIEALRQEVSLLKEDLKKLEQSAPVAEIPFNPAAFQRPVAGHVVQSFGWVHSGNSWTLNETTVLSVPPGSRIFAAAPGKVKEVKGRLDGGYEIIIDHGSGWESVYSNLGQALVQSGQQVIPQVVVGLADESGTTVDAVRVGFAIYHNRRPVDPEKILGGFFTEGVSQ